MRLTRKQSWRWIIALILTILFPIILVSGCTSGEATDADTTTTDNIGSDVSVNQGGTNDNADNVSNETQTPNEEEQAQPIDNATDSPANNRPVARLTASATDVYVGTTVSFDGSTSHDSESESVTPAWSFAKPDNSQATLVISDNIRCEFIPDVPGTYNVTLIVADGEGLGSLPATITVITTVDPTKGHDLRASGFNTVSSADPGDTIDFDISIVNSGEFIETAKVEILITGPETSQTMGPVTLGSIDAGFAPPSFNNFTSYLFPVDAPDGNYSFQARVFSDAGDENWNNNYSTATLYLGVEPQIIETNAYQYEYRLIYWNESLGLPDEYNSGGFGWIDYNGYQIAISPNVTDDETFVHIKNSDGTTIESHDKVYAGRAYLYDNGKLMVKYDMYADAVDAVGIEVGIAVPGVVTVTPAEAVGIVGQPTAIDIDLGGRGECCFNDGIFEYLSNDYFLNEKDSNYHSAVMSASGTVEDYGWKMELTPLVVGTHEFVMELDGENDVDYYVWGKLIADSP